MTQPIFAYVPLNEDGTRCKVYTDADHTGYLGIVYDTAGGGWAADWDTRGRIAMPGFQSPQDAAAALYGFAPPVQSFGSRPIGDLLGAVDELQIDMSQCRCCVNNNCECEGLDRISEQFGVTQSYQVQPSLIPKHGVLVSLTPMSDGSFLVDLNTRAAGVSIGYLQKRDDDRFDVRTGAKSIGIAPKPETGMWACCQAHIGTEFYGRLPDGFEPHEQART